MQMIPRSCFGIGAYVALCLLTLGTIFSSHTVQAQSEQKIAVLVNDYPITAYDINQRVLLLTLNDRSIGKLLREKLKSPSTTERFRKFINQERPKSQEEVNRLKDRFVKQLQKEVRKKIAPRLRKKAIEELIDERLMLQDAKKLNITISEADVEERIASLAKSSKNRRTGKPLNSEQFLNQLRGLNVNIKAFKGQLRATIAFQQVLRRKYGNDIRTAARQQTAKALDRAGADGVGSKQTEFQLQKIKLALPTGADQKTIAARLVEAEGLRSRFSSCKDTRKLMKPFKGGSVQTLGTRSAGQIDQPIRSILLQAKAGEMTPPSVTGTAIELYAVCSRRQTAGNSTEKRQLQAKFQQQEFSVLSRRHLRNIRQDAHIDYR